MIIELPNEIRELGLIRFKELVSINLYYVDRKNKIAYFEWDFGMDAKVYLDSYMLEERASRKIKDKIMMQIQYDLGHAFFHYDGDPNYTYYHWALYGMLRDRVELIDEEFTETNK